MLDTEWRSGRSDMEGKAAIIGLRTAEKSDILHLISGVTDGKRLENLNGPVKVINQEKEIIMSQHPAESKRLLSHTIAEWACALKYEHLSAEAIQAAKLFWFDSIGCALGGSQQDDAKILLKHYRAMSSAKAASRDSSTSLGMTNKHARAIGGGNGKATVFVSG